MDYRSHRLSGYCRAFPFCFQNLSSKTTSRKDNIICESILYILNSCPLLSPPGKKIQAVHVKKVTKSDKIVVLTTVRWLYGIDHKIIIVSYCLEEDSIQELQKAKPFMKFI